MDEKEGIQFNEFIVLLCLLYLLIDSSSSSDNVREYCPLRYIPSLSSRSIAPVVSLSFDFYCFLLFLILRLSYILLKLLFSMCCYAFTSVSPF